MDLWKTILNDNEYITYDGELFKYLNNYHTFFPSKNKSIKFNFIGSRIQLIFATDINGNYSNAKISIDNKINEQFSTIKDRSEKTVVYENTSLKFKEHFVTITGLDDKYLIFYGININKNGKILKYNNQLYKYLLKQNNQYYSTKTEFYDVENKIYLPCERDFNKNGISDLSQLITNITINSETFNPIMKFKGEIGLIQAEEKQKE